MNSSTTNKKHLRKRLAFVFCLLMVPVLVWAQNTTTKKPAKPAPAAAAPARNTPAPVQPQTVRTPSPPAQPQGRVPVAPAYPNQPMPPINRTYGAPTRDATPARPPFSTPSGAYRATRPDGTATITHPDGRKWVVGSNGQPTHFSKPGMDARFGHDGRPSFIHDDKRGITINRAPNGARQVVSVRPDGARVVSFGMNRGYVERPARRGYVQRTYVMGGRRYVTVYRTYSYRGIAYQRYVPAVYYQPGFYMWAARPWSAPISYDWGWNAQPWYGAYPGYFTPARVYSDAALWLTDSLLAENLRMAYDQQLGAQAPPQSDEQPAPISQGVKLALANEVRRQLAASSQEAATQSTAAPASPSANPPVALPAALDPAQRVFVIASNLDVPTSGDTTCALGPGDIVIRTDDQIGAGDTVGVTVLSSKAGDCPGNSTASIEVTALQEAHNQFVAQIDSGLGVLAQNGGTGSIPSGPPAGAFNSRDGQAPADSNSEASLIQQQQQSANQSELEARLASNGAGQ